MCLVHMAGQRRLPDSGRMGPSVNGQSDNMRLIFLPSILHNLPALNH